LTQALVGEEGLRLHLGRWRQPQHSSGGGPSGLSGYHRCPARRSERGHRAGRWLPGIDRILGQRVYPEAQEQRCWKHKVANVLDKLPKRLQARAKETIHEIMYAPDRESALEEIERFSQQYGARYPRALETLIKDQEQLLTFFDFPARHWIHLRTTNPIESTFATVKARTKKTKGAGSRKAGLVMAVKLLLAREQRWRRINAPHLVALVKTGVEFPDGQAEMLDTEPAPSDTFTPVPWMIAAKEPVHKI